MDTVSSKKRILLHSCCGPCSTAVLERLTSEGYDVTVFYFNPNITERDEYEHRLSEQKRFLSEYCANTGAEVAFIEGEYDPQEFFESVRGLENEPEGGKRCEKCFALRMRKAAELAIQNGFDYFDTTMSVSPHKNYDLICKIGSSLENEDTRFLAGNYKKKDGFFRSIELSKEYSLYRQSFCGCVFSRRQSGERTL